MRQADKATREAIREYAKYMGVKANEVAKSLGYEWGRPKPVASPQSRKWLPAGFVLAPAFMAVMASIALTWKHPVPPVDGGEFRAVNDPNQRDDRWPWRIVRRRSSSAACCHLDR